MVFILDDPFQKLFNVRVANPLLMIAVGGDGGPFRLAPDDKCLLLSGRVSSQILIKAGHSGIPIVVSRAALTSLAVDLADEFSIALVGFARGERMNIYSHPEKVIM